ncbi:MAG: AlpA family phage regulatory protein [Deltaproteobacteria bacterium]|nr:AlpA family phage regulatory protein [Deltaproteobacteria bacterium]
MKDRILREPEVLNLTGLSRTTIWRLEKEGSFPRRVKISRQAVGWLFQQIQKWMEQKHEISLNIEEGRDGRPRSNT